MKMKIATTTLASILLLSPLSSYAYADSSVVEKSSEQTNATTFEDFTKNTPPIIDKSQDPTVIYSETIKYDENENIIDRQVSGSEVKINIDSKIQGQIINDGGFNWKYVGYKEADNKINKDAYNVSLILVGAFSNFLPKFFTSIAMGVTGSLMYFYQPPVVTYQTGSYRDYDAVNEYVKTETITRNANGARMYYDTKVQKFVK